MKPKKVAKQTKAEPVRLTKRQLSRYQRETKLQRATLIGAAVVVALVVIVLAFGLWREVLAKPGEAVARVNGKPITAETFARVLGYNENNLDLQMLQLQDYLNRTPAPTSGDEENPDFLRQYVQQQLQQLQFRKFSLESEVLEQLIDNELVREEAARRGITVSGEEVDQFLMQQLSPSNPVTSTTTITPTEQADTPGQTPTSTKTLPEVLAEVRQALAQTGFLNEADFRYHVLEPNLLESKLKKAIGDAAKTSGEQIRASHILVETEEEARNVLARVKEQGQDFAAVAKEQSKDPGSAANGGDLGWFSRGSMVPEFEEAAFGLLPGQISEPVRTQFGFHIIRLEEHQSDREFSSDQMDRVKDNAYNDWLTTAKSPDSKKVERLDSPATNSWARNWVNGKKKQLAEESRKQAQIPKK